MASASAGTSEVVIGTSSGFNAAYKRSTFGFSAVVLAEKDGQMERDYDYSSAVFAEDLKKPELVGQNAHAEHYRALWAQTTDRHLSGNF